MNTIERKYGCKVIPIVHPIVQKKKSWFKMAFSSGDDKEDSVCMKTLSRVLDIMRDIEPEKPIFLFLHTLGGEAAVTKTIMDIFKRHKGKVTAFIPQFAYSAGSQIALAADEIVMEENATLGPFDVQLFGVVPAFDILEMIKGREGKDISELWEVLGHKSRKNVDADEELIRRALGDRYEKKVVDQVISHMLGEKFDHSHTFSPYELREMGLEITVRKMEDDLYKWFARLK